MDSRPRQGRRPVGTGAPSGGANVTGQDQMICRMPSRLLGLLACAAMVLAPVTVQAETNRAAAKMSRDGAGARCCCCKPGIAEKHVCGCCPAKSSDDDTSMPGKSQSKGCCDTDGCHCNAGLCGGSVFPALPAASMSITNEASVARLGTADPTNTGATRQTDVFHPPRC